MKKYLAIIPVLALGLFFVPNTFAGTVAEQTIHSSLSRTMTNSGPGSNQYWGCQTLGNGLSGNELNLYLKVKATTTQNSQFIIYLIEKNTLVDSEKCTFDPGNNSVNYFTLTQNWITGTDYNLLLTANSQTFSLNPTKFYSLEWFGGSNLKLYGSFSANDYGNGKFFNVDNQNPIPPAQITLSNDPTIKDIYFILLNDGSIPEPERELDIDFITPSENETLEDFPEIELDLYSGSTDCGTLPTNYECRLDLKIYQNNSIIGGTSITWNDSNFPKNLTINKSSINLEPGNYTLQGVFVIRNTTNQLDDIKYSENNNFTITESAPEEIDLSVEGVYLENPNNISALTPVQFNGRYTITSDDWDEIQFEFTSTNTGVVSTFHYTFGEGFTLQSPSEGRAYNFSICVNCSRINMDGNLVEGEHYTYKARLYDDPDAVNPERFGTYSSTFEFIVGDNRAIYEDFESTDSPFYVDCSRFDGVSFFTEGVFEGIFCYTKKAMVAFAGIFFDISPSATQGFNEAVNNIKNGFPFGTFFAIISSIDNQIDEIGNGQTLSVTFPPPLDHTFPILTPTLLEDIVGTEFKDMIFNTIVTLTWIMVAIIILKI